MYNADTVKLLELLSSKICHDLISPVGAVANGVEILQELGTDDPDSDVTDLIAFSAGQANAKLKVLRLVYGLGGSDSSITPEDIHKIFGDFISGERRLSQNWDPRAHLGIQPRTGFSKILLACLLFATEGLPKGGVLSVKAEDDNTTRITAQGENAHFRAGFVNALEHKTSINDIDPKLTHAYVTGLLAKHYGFEISVDESENDFIVLRLKSVGVS